MPLLRCFAATVVLCWLSGSASAQHGAEPTFNEVDVVLSSQAKEALDNGIALTFNCRFAKVQRFLFFSWEKDVKQHQFVISHHTISNRYVVRRDNIATPEMFRSLDSATEFLKEQAEVLFGNYVSQDKDYQMRLSLSRTELPGPMRLFVYFAEAWDLDTGWVQWESES